ncbi:hypothetical protein ACHAXT_001299 [Thalassiosira profunda]
MPMDPRLAMNSQPSPADENTGGAAANQGFQGFDFAAATAALAGHQDTAAQLPPDDGGDQQATLSAPGLPPLPPPMGAGGGVQDDGNNLGANLQALQSLLQAQQQPLGGGYPQLTSHVQDATAAMPPAAAPTGSEGWQSCRFCQEQFLATPERLLEHEISCPMHLQVQQFLQQQQNAFAQGNPLGQLQLQLQVQQQLQAQMGQGDSMQTQGEMPGMQGMQDMQSPMMGAAFGAGMNPFQTTGTNPFQTNDLQPMAQIQEQVMQGQGLSMLPHETSVGSHHSHHSAVSVVPSHMPALPPVPHQVHQVSHGARELQHQASATSEADQFESAIDRLPAFDASVSSGPVAAATPAATKPLQPLESSGPQSATDYFPLALPEDEEWLTPLHCFVRRYCVEIFVATPDDVAAPCMGKRNPVSVNQVGIRCPYCSPERMGTNDQGGVDVTRARENGVVYPSLIGRIYNSSINLLQRHLKSCAFVPAEVLAKYEELKSSNARSGASKKYWADSAARLGLVDTPDGIRLDKEVLRNYREDRKSKGPGEAAAKAEKGEAAVEAPPLVLPSDKRHTTAFTFHLMSQMQPCVFTEADRLGRRRNLDVGFAGLACRHCFGVYGSGRFFPSSVKTMADASKTLDVIFRHVTKCTSCPNDIKGGLKNLREFHDAERSKMPFGNQRAFFVKIWGRLHEGCANEGVGASVPALPAPIFPAPSTAALVAAAQATSLTNVALPSVPMAETKVPALPAPVVADRDAATKLPSSVHGLYAMVKRASEVEGSSEDLEQPNKMTTEAA